MCDFHICSKLLLNRGNVSKVFFVLFSSVIFQRSMIGCRSSFPSPRRHKNTIRRLDYSTGSRREGHWTIFGQLRKIVSWKHKRKLARLTFQRLDVVAWKDPGLAVALSFPPVGLVLGQDHDLVSSLKGQLILVLTGVSVNRTVLLTTWKQDSS